MRWLCRGFLVPTLVFFLCATTSLASTLSDGKGALRVMTYNMYAGTNFLEPVAAQTPEEFLAAVAFVNQHVLATDPAERIAAIAKQIADAQPHLVSLQEVATWRAGTDPANLELEADYLPMLLKELRSRGQHYTSAISLVHFDFTAPGAGGIIVRATLRVAILARTDLDREDFSFTNAQGALFHTNLTIPHPVLGTIEFPRGWVSVDVKFHERKLRFVATHLEAFSPLIAIAQGQELTAPGGPADTPLPVVLAADFNSRADDVSDPSHAIYQNLRDAGFQDAWLVVFPNISGFTCCQSPEVNNGASLLDQRIDLILFRGQIGAKTADIFGEEQGDRTPSGFWPSDHAGVAARLKLAED